MRLHRVSDLQGDRDLLRRLQQRRQGRLNADLDVAGVERWCELNAEAHGALSDASRRRRRRRRRSGRAYHRLLRVARTVADLEGAERIEAGHVCEAAGFRALEGDFETGAAVWADSGGTRVRVDWRRGSRCCRGRGRGSSGRAAAENRAHLRARIGTQLQMTPSGRMTS
ncbi:MAG: hypothetical protein ACREU3_01090 [Steroidobacteraceae bacterium]